MSIQQLLIGREVGFSVTKRDLEESTDLLIGENQINDCFNFKATQLLPENSHFEYSLSKNFISVLTKDETEDEVPKIYHLSLWSLASQSKLWDLQLDANDEEYSIVKVSDCGAVLISDSLNAAFWQKNTIIIFNGAESGILPQFDWQSISFIGRRIFGSCYEGKHFFFDELDLHGQHLSRSKLHGKYSANRSKTFYSEDFWIRCVGGWKHAFCKKTTHPTIEVVNLTNKTVEVIKLPYDSEGLLDEFYPLGIFKNQFIFSTMFCAHGDPPHPWKKASICIFDLASKKIEEFPTALEPEEQIKKLGGLVTNQRYLAWLEGGATICVKYLNLKEKKVQVAKGVVLTRSLKSLKFQKYLTKICGKALSITYLRKGPNNRKYYFRQVIHLTNGEVKQSIRYKWRKDSQMLMSTRNVLIIDRRLPQMYIEDFTDQDPSNGISPLRIKQATTPSNSSNSSSSSSSSHT